MYDYFLLLQQIMKYIAIKLYSTRFPGCDKAFWDGQKAISFSVYLYYMRRLRFIFAPLAHIYSPAILPSKETARYLWRRRCLFPPLRPPLCHHMAGISRFPRDHWRMSSEHLCPSLSLSFARRRVACLMHCNGWPLFTQGINKEKRGIDGVIHSRSH